jgi:hypothetical protein
MRSSSGLQRKTPLKQGSGFKRPERKPAPKQVLRPATRRASYDGTAVDGATPKDQPVRSEAYRRLVAMLPCFHCRAPGPTQAAHPNTGKGMGLKTDDRRCFPMCPACHTGLDQGGLFTKEERRDFEARAEAQTREVIRQAGLWPEPLPAWPGEG